MVYSLSLQDVGEYWLVRWPKTSACSVLVDDEPEEPVFPRVLAGDESRSGGWGDGWKGGDESSGRSFVNDAAEVWKKTLLHKRSEGASCRSVEAVEDDFSLICKP